MGNNDKGRFVWHELHTTDVKKARSFYGELLGWKTKEVPMGESTYEIISVDGRDIGGLMKSETARSSWLGYAAVDDVDATAAAAKKRGGKELVPPSDIPGVGRFSVLADPQGAVLAAFKGSEGYPPEPEKAPFGTFCWDELWTTDVSVAREYYSALFGYSVEEAPMPGVTYLLFKRGKVETAGAMKSPDPKVPPMWLTYVVVNDVDQAFARAQKLGGQALNPPADIPGIGRFAIVADPTGAPIALYKSARE